MPIGVRTPSSVRICTNPRQRARASGEPVPPSPPQNAWGRFHPLAKRVDAPRFIAMSGDRLVRASGRSPDVDGRSSCGPAESGHGGGDHVSAARPREASAAGGDNRPGSRRCRPDLGDIDMGVRRPGWMRSRNSCLKRSSRERDDPACTPKRRRPGFSRERDNGDTRCVRFASRARSATSPLEGKGKSIGSWLAVGTRGRSRAFRTRKTGITSRIDGLLVSSITRRFRCPDAFRLRWRQPVLEGAARSTRSSRPTRAPRGRPSRGADSCSLERRCCDCRIVSAR